MRGKKVEGMPLCIMSRYKVLSVNALRRVGEANNPILEFYNITLNCNKYWGSSRLLKSLK
jgi:hypothetical protein